MFNDVVKFIKNAHLRNSVNTLYEYIYNSVIIYNSIKRIYKDWIYSYRSAKIIIMHDLR